MTDDEQLRNKRFNEEMKWLSSALANGALVILGWAFFGPAIDGRPASPNQSFWIFLAIGL
ncbi:MAG: hypothetical protein JO172_01110 [Hyphomicrobiales bacterium]|nr:hypothetical protein [Hyphomicrobiales bacterium]